MSMRIRFLGTVVILVSAFWACVPDYAALSSDFHPGTGGTGSSTSGSGGSSGTGLSSGRGSGTGGTVETGGTGADNPGGAPEGGAAGQTMGQAGQGTGGSGGSVAQPSSCSNDVADANETDVDCGGSSLCPRCDVKQKCAHNSDCLSGFCKKGTVCATPTCNDGYKNQDETGVDCGGACSALDQGCDIGVACASDDDCTSGYCSNKVCTDHCVSNRRDGDETDVDCGGKECKPCADQSRCLGPSDCQSGICNNNTCIAATCSDNVTNQDESDTDCGGVCAPPKYCALNARCNSGADCVSYVCNTSGRCDPDLSIPAIDVLDDFEGGTFSVPNTGGRIGNWYNYGDMTGGITSTWVIADIPKQRGPQSHKALHFAGSGYTNWGCGAGADLNNAGTQQGDKKPYDASFDNNGTPTPYAGVTFWARSDGGTLNLGVVFPDGDTDAAGGICNMSGGTCDHHYLSSVSVGSDWKRYTILFKDLMLEAGTVPTPGPFDPTRLVSVQFRISSNTTFDLWVDDVAFVRPQ
jgi:hypothetical protein